MNSMQNSQESYKILAELFEKSTHKPYIGEPISQKEHALQAAALARAANAPDTVVIAALLHDVGHLDRGNAEFQNKMDEFGVASHENVGAKFVSELGFPPEVASLIRGHVEAKRYLVSKHPSYFEQLSPASLETLKHQGGRMTEAEITIFENDPLAKDKLRLRAWDDQAKLENHEVPDFESYRPTLLALLSRESR